MHLSPAAKSAAIDTLEGGSIAGKVGDMPETRTVSSISPNNYADFSVGETGFEFV